MELADLVVINKADLDPAAATRAQGQIVSALRLFGQHGRSDHALHDESVWHTAVMQLSALSGAGIDAFWSHIERFRALQRSSGRGDARRRRQSEAWMWDMIQSGLRRRFAEHPAVRAALPSLTERVLNGRLAPSTAARDLLTRFASASS